MGMAGHSGGTAIAQWWAWREHGGGHSRDMVEGWHGGDEVFGMAGAPGGRSGPCERVVPCSLLG